MSKIGLAVLMALFPACAFAVDGVVLINQSTVLATGGFPYTISAAGSYRLSGNLTAPSNTQAILVAASNVSLDLNGFNIVCEFDTPGAPINCVGESAAATGGISDVSVRNGTVSYTLTGAIIIVRVAGVGFYSSTNVIVEELHMEALGLAAGGAQFVLTYGANSIIRHNVLSPIGHASEGGSHGACPSLIAENTTSAPNGSHSGSGCVLVNNVGPF